MRRSLFFILASLISFTGFAQMARQPLISSYIKGGAYSKQADVFSFSANQASLAAIKTFTAGVFGERKFLLSELNLFSAAFALPTHSGNFGLQLHQFGNTAYSETQAGLAYARKLSDYVDAGVQFNYYNLRIAGYGNAATINFDAGLLFHFTEQLHGGVHVYNPTSSRIGKTETEKLPAVYSAGLGYDATENFFVSTEIEKTEDMPLNVNATLQYRFADHFLARGGVVTNTSTFFLGIGFTFQSFRFDATASVHPQLGVTPGVLIIYSKPAKD